MGNWRIKSTLEGWENVAGMLEGELQTYGFTDKFINSLMLAMDETIANITSYAYGEGQGEILIKSEYEVNSCERIAEIIFMDSGKKFNPLEEAEEPDIKEMSAIKRNAGGLGIFLIKKQTDELKYSYENSYNKLTLIKKEKI